MSDSTVRMAGKLSRKPYPMRVFWDEEDESWVAEVLDLPGCVGAGDTAQEALETAQGFIEAWIEDALESGETVPAPSAQPQASGRFLARVPRSIHGRLQQIAEDEGVSLNQLVVSILSEGVAGRGISTAVTAIIESLQKTPDHSGTPVIQNIGYRRQIELRPEQNQWELKNAR